MTGGKYGPTSPFRKDLKVVNGNSATTPSEQAPNLSGLVSVKAYEKLYSNEVPAVTCSLLPTQLDHLKVLFCEEENLNHPKLTQEASEKLEIEKQSQVKVYMDDIVGKLQSKERKYKITSKKKFVEDALNAESVDRVASVYVVVLNREKNYDPVVSHKMSQRFTHGYKRISSLVGTR